MDFTEISASEWKEARLSKNLTQMQTAAAAGLGSQGLVSQVENGLKPGPDTARRLAEVLFPASSESGPVQKARLADAAEVTA